MIKDTDCQAEEVSKCKRVISPNRWKFVTRDQARDDGVPVSVHAVAPDMPPRCRRSCAEFTIALVLPICRERGITRTGGAGPFYRHTGVSRARWAISPFLPAVCRRVLFVLRRMVQK